MKTIAEHNERMARTIFASVHPYYLTKVQKKDRTREELQQVIKWLTGFDKNKIQALLNEKVTFKFFQNANLNPNSHLLTGLIWPRKN